MCIRYRRYLTKGLYEEAKKSALEYQDIFGKGNYFLELQDHGIPDQALVNQRLLQMSEELEIELAATNDVHYTLAEDEKPHEDVYKRQTVFGLFENKAQARKAQDKIREKALAKQVYVTNIHGARRIEYGA